MAESAYRPSPVDPIIGVTVSHYRVTSTLGSGGMGVVYRAEDIRLGRPVAIKFLPKELISNRQALERFQREARAASALEHPNICSIYDIGERDGQPYIVMQYLDGTTLRQQIERKPLPVERILDLGIQIAEGLNAAHSRGIIHRDIKPANIFVTADGQIKILDFGLAKLAPSPVNPASRQGEASTVDDHLTHPGTAVGTVAYMSPEQARGEELDSRSDLFSLGSLMYELTSGVVAFSGSTTAVVFEAILNRVPPPMDRMNPGIPLDLDRIVSKALEKDPKLRYQTAADLRSDLDRLKRDLSSSRHPAALADRSKTPGVKRRVLLVAIILLVLAVVLGSWFYGRNADETIGSIAVLPFTSESAEPNTVHLSDGIAENIRNSLSQIPDLMVVPRFSVDRYRGVQLDAKKMRQDLKVHAVLTGRVTQHGDSLSVSVELVDLSEDRQIWGTTYSRQVADVLALQESISSEITKQLRLRLSAEDRNRLETYNLYQKGQYYWEKRTAESLDLAINAYNQAIERDPKFALAYAGLANSYALLSYYSATPPRESFPKAKKAAETALALDENVAEAHAALGLVLRDYEHNWEGSEAHFKRALALDPNYSTAHQWYGEYLAARGRFAQASQELTRAQQLSPSSLIIGATLGWVFYCEHRSDEAIQHLRRTVEMDPSFAPAHWFLGWALEQKKDYINAEIELKKAFDLSGGSTRIMADLAHVQAQSGKIGEAQKILRQLEESSASGRYVSPFEFAVVYAGMGQKELAFNALEKAAEDRPWELVNLKVDPLLDNLRDDARFPAMVRRLGL